MATPSLLDRVRLAYRGFTLPSLVGTWEYLLADYGRGSTAGISVSEESALRFSPVWAGVSILSRDIAKLPLVLFKNLPNGGKERYTTHPLYRVLHDEANPEMSSFKFRETMQALTILWGNSFAEIVRDEAGRVRGLYPIVPHRVSVLRDDRSGQLVYRVQEPSGRQSLIAPRNMLHLSALSLDGIMGQAITHLGSESIGLGIAVEKFGGSFFGNGATFGGVVEFPQTMTAEKRKEVREAIEAVHQGVERAHKILVLAGGAKFTERGTPPDHAQFLETRQFQVNEVARWLTMPPHKLGDLENAHFTNIEEEEIGYHQNTLAGWLQMWEQELRRKLIAPLEYSQQTIAHVMQGVMRGNSTQRADFYTKMFMLGALSPNDILRLEDMNPIGPAGDVHMAPLNMIPLERYDEYITATLAAKTPPKELTGGSKDAVEPEDRDVAALRQEIAVLAQRADQHTAAVATLSEHIATTTGEALTLKMEVTRQQELAEAARTELAVKQALLERTERDLSEERAARAALDSAAVAQAAAVATLEAAKATLDEQRSILVATLTQREQELQDRTAAVQAAEERYAAATSAAAFERTAADAALTEARQAREDSQAALEAAHAAVAEAQRAQAQLESDLDTRAATLAAAERRVQELTTLHDEERAARDAAQAVVAERDAAVTEAQRAQAAAEATAAQLEDVLGTTRAAAATLEARVEADRQWRASMVMAIRDALEDAFGRMARTEVERARKRSSNPETLRRWADSFYDEHGRDACAGILRPAVKAYLAWSRSSEDPKAVARRFADEYCDYSSQRLTSLADGMVGEEFQTTLQRMLGSWEHERPQQVAEQVVTNALRTLLG
jgi:HK97 family phage portal protein